MNGQYNPGDIVLGNWTLMRLIGEGSFGRVFEAEREDFGTTYRAAIKIITIPKGEAEIRAIRAEGMDDDSITAYFRSFVEEVVREFALMSELKGTANIVSYEDHTVIEHPEGIGWDIIIRMELLTPLLDYSAEHTFTRQTVTKLGIDMCKALELCQRYNIIHRDIKPENIFVSKLGDFKLGDFGIARTVEKTTSGLSKKGTYTYMAPEVYRDEAYGSAVDIYSLGIVLYRLLNDNRTPFLPAYPAPITYNDQETARGKRLSGAMLPTPKNADGRLAEIVLKACAYDPKDRYSSPMQMRQELEVIMYDQVDAKIIYPEGDTTPVKSVEYVEESKPPKVITPVPEGTAILFSERTPDSEKTVSLHGEVVQANTDVDIAPNATLTLQKLQETKNQPDNQPESTKKKRLFKPLAIVATIAAVFIAGIILTIILLNNTNDPVITDNQQPPVDPVVTDNQQPPEDIIVEEDQQDSVSVGYIIKFGGYDWRVLDVKDGKALILSDIILAYRAYHGVRGSVQWVHSDIRSYLNGAFYNNFNAADRAMIVETEVVNAINPTHGTSGGNDTVDKIFLLSIDEVNGYFSDNTSRIAYFISGNTSWWWLRSPGFSTGRAAYVSGSGDVGLYGRDVGISPGGVRPALWLNLES